MLAPNIPPKNPHSWSPCRWYLTWIKKTKNRQWARNIYKNIQNTKFHHVSPRLIARYKFYIYISSYFSKICHEFGGIQNWKEMVKSKPWAVAGIVQNSVHLSVFSIHWKRSAKRVPKWSLKPRAPAERRSVVPHMLGSCTGVKAKPLPEQVPNAWFLRMTACHLNVPKKSQTFFQEFETSNSIVKSV